MDQIHYDYCLSVFDVHPPDCLRDQTGEHGAPAGLRRYGVSTYLPRPLNRPQTLICVNTVANGFTYQNDVLYADGHPLDAIAAQYGTPSYVYSASLIRHNIERLRQTLGPDVLIAFACKSNTNGAILRIMAAMGLGADVVSGGELRRARLANIPSDKIVFSGVGKTDQELRYAIEEGILQINIESGAELERLLSIDTEKPVRIGFRLNPDIDAGTHAKISTGHGNSKFGMPADEILSLYRMIEHHPMLRPSGLSIHIGSQLTRLEPFEHAFHALAQLASHMPAVETLDFGGGLGIVYSREPEIDLNGYAALVHKILRPLGKKLVTEPGRFLVANAGIILASVIDVKKTPSRPIVILDAGMNDLMRPALYDAIHTVLPVHQSRNEDCPSSLDIVGPVCESSDVFLQDQPIPIPARDDLVILKNCGAYGFSMANTYNSRPLPPEILVDGDRIALVRARQDFDAIIEDELIPDWIT